MIPRRIGEHVKAHNWFAVAIDFVIVVLGVFVGIQVSNWNVARAERASEAIYLANIVEDLRADMAEIDGITTTAASRMAALEALFGKVGEWRRPETFPSSRGVAAIAPARPFDGANGETIAGELFILNTLDGNRFTYETLINTGGIGIIRDKSLVRDIQKYYAAVDQADHFEISLEENRARLIDLMQADGLSALDAMSADAFAAVARGDPALLASARNYWLYANRQIVLMNGLRDKAEKLASIIEHERH